MMREEEREREKITTRAVLIRPLCCRLRPALNVVVVPLWFSPRALVKTDDEDAHERVLSLSLALFFSLTLFSPFPISLSLVGFSLQFYY